MAILAALFLALRASLNRVVLPNVLPHIAARVLRSSFPTPCALQASSASSCDTNWPRCCRRASLTPHTAVFSLSVEDHQRGVKYPHSGAS